RMWTRRSASASPGVNAPGVSQAMERRGSWTVSVTVARFWAVVGGGLSGTGSTAGPLGIGAKYLVRRALSWAGLKSPAMAMLALLGVENCWWKSRTSLMRAASLPAWGP